MRRQDRSTKATTFATKWTLIYHPQQVRQSGKSIDTNRLGRESMVHVMITGTSCVLQISSLDCLLPQNIGSESFSFFHIFISFPKMCLERIFQSLLPGTKGEFIQCRIIQTVLKAGPGQCSDCARKFWKK